MKKALRLSVFLNCVLAILAAWPAVKARVTDRIAVTSCSRENLPSANPGAPIASQPLTFNWSAVESSDYPTYIANLRAIGCPEPTIRDIIKADVHSLYAARCESLEQKRKLTGTADLVRLDREFQALSDEETRVIAKLLAPEKQHGEPDKQRAPDPELPQLRKAVVAHRPAVMPLVFQPAELQSLSLNAAQIQTIRMLRQRFVEEIGGMDQDTSTPEYRERWEQSQPVIDQDLRGMIGVKAYQEYQVQAHAATPGAAVASEQ